MISPRHTSPSRDELLGKLVDFFSSQGIEVKNARNLRGYPEPPPINNEGYGYPRETRPDVIGFDQEKRRVVFGLVRIDRKSLDSEQSLEEYNVFLDHNAGLGSRASVVYVMMPHDLLVEFSAIITHYIHREYWDRIVAVGTATTGEGESWGDT